MMKVKALARLSTAQGWRSPGEEFTVTAAEAEDLEGRSLIERSVTEPAAEAEPRRKTPKPTKPKS